MRQIHEHIGATSFVVVAAYIVLFLTAWRVAMLHLPDDSPLKAGMATIV